MNILYEYLSALVIFVAIDLIWIFTIVLKVYKKELGSVFLTKFKKIPAIIFYLLYILGLVIFVLNPAIQSSSFNFSLLGGLLFGLVSYATYDLTNLSTLKGWSIYISIIDIIWGAILTGIVSILVFYIFVR